MYGVPMGTDSYVTAMLDLLAPRPPRPPHLPHHLHLQGGTGQGALHAAPTCSDSVCERIGSRRVDTFADALLCEGHSRDRWRPRHDRHKQEIMRLLGWCGVASTGEGVATTEEGVVTTGEGVATTEEGVVTTEEGVATTGEGVVTTGEGVATTGEGVATSVEGRVREKRSRRPRRGRKASILTDNFNELSVFH